MKSHGLRFILACCYPLLGGLLLFATYGSAIDDSINVYIIAGQITVFSLYSLY